jgi:hypothetical protein
MKICVHPLCSGTHRVSLLIQLTLAALVASSPSFAQGQTLCLQPPSGVVGWWSFDETSGNIAADRTGNNPGAWVNNPVPAPGEVRGALSFNGTNYVTVQDSPLWNFGANNFTIELWANFSAPPGGSVGEPAAVLVGNDEGPGDVNKWFFAVGGGNLYFHINSPTLGPLFFPLVPFSPVVGQWYHLAVVRTGSTYTVFIDGVASGSATNTDVIPDANAPLTMGEGENIGFMNGLLDETTIYNRGLEPEEIAAIYNAGSSGKCISLQISPSAGGDTGNVSVNINGIGFEQGATVSLAMTGQSSIAGSPVTVGANGTNIATTFNLTGQTDGAWDVVINNPDGTSQTLPQGFTVQPGTGPQIWVDVVGIGLIVPGRAQAFQMFYGNTGNVDAAGVPLWIAGIPPDATLSLGFNVFPPLPLDPNVGYSQVPTYFDLGTELEGSFVVPVIAAGSTGALQISVTVPSLENFQLQAWANPPWFGGPAPPTSAKSGRGPSKSERKLRRSLESWGQPLEPSSTSDLLGCSVGVLDALNGGLSLSAPQQACVGSLLQVYETTLTTEGAVFTGEQPGWSDVFNLVWAFGQEAYQCTTALACTACQTPVIGEALPESCVACMALNIGQIANIVVSAYQTSAACTTVALQTGGALGTLAVVAIDSFDPNNKVGSLGVGPAQFVTAQQPLRYSISFENDPAATAPAQQVVVTDQLDPTKVDLTTLSLGPIAFGSNQLIPPPALGTFAVTVNLQPGMDLLVEVTGSLDPNTGLLTWQFISIDPATGDPPTDPAIGFLPPDVTPPEGEGSVLFTVMPKQGIALGTQITNQATIVFDANPPISTPTWLNTIGATPPVTVTPAASTITTAQALAVTIAVTGISGNPAPTGTVTLTSGSYTSAATTLSGGNATIGIPAGSLAVGTDTLTVSYSGDGNYIPASGTSSVIVAALPFTVSGSNVSVAPGASTGNSSTITLTPSGGFTGSVTLAAAITNSPTGAVDLPTLSFGSTSPANITSTGPAMATLTISTTAATSSALAYPARPRGRWNLGGSAGLALVPLFILGIPARRRNWRTRLGLSVVLIVAGGLFACGGGGSGSSVSGIGPTGNPGTTPGAYTVTVTGTSGSTTATGTVTLTVQ